MLIENFYGTACVTCFLSSLVVLYFRLISSDEPEESSPEGMTQFFQWVNSVSFYISLMALILIILKNLLWSSD